MALQTGIFSQLLAEENARIATRSSLENPQTPISFPAEWLLDIFNGGRTDSGIRVSQLTALQVVEVLSCVDLISGSIASLPCFPYQRSFLKNGRAVHKIAYDHDYFDLVSLQPNDEMSHFVLFKTMAVHFLLWGNSYNELQRNASNGIIAIWPRNPHKTRPKRLAKDTYLKAEPWRPIAGWIPAGTLVYVTTDGVDDYDNSSPGASSTNNERIIPADDMLHIPGLSLDGRLGQDIIYLARQTIGLALVSEKFGAKYFGNYARPGGIVGLPVGATKEQRDEARKSWMEAQGGENASRPAVMPAGFTWTDTGNNPEEAQAVELQQLVRNRICALFHVPPHKMGDVDKGRANTEQLAQEYVTDTLTPWLQAIRQEWKRKLFPSRGIGRTPRNNYYIDFDLWGVVRPDAQSRERFYSTARTIAGICSNDFREYEGLNPIDEDWAERFWMPINMTDVTTPVDPTHQDGEGNGDQPSKDEGQKQDQETKAAARYAHLYSRMWRDAFGRILARKNADIRDFSLAFGPILWSLADIFAAEQRGKYSADTDAFIADYLGGMIKRSQSWTAVDENASPELVRAIKALRIAVYRDVATQAALEEESGVTE